MTNGPNGIITSPNGINNPTPHLGTNINIPRISHKGDNNKPQAPWTVGFSWTHSWRGNVVMAWRAGEQMGILWSFIGILKGFYRHWTVYRDFMGFYRELKDCYRIFKGISWGFMRLNGNKRDVNQKSDFRLNPD